ncbi:MAG: hypothetical protein A3G41_04000 [Elusimicrobia bacterium RIFCSPLOWO2_12_FULL_59_9]|nr:MAG: hypothetical protein A3G41_04000 [Elusimicrobia bacterium RIFCSPLOWO2_12_FULL_59_9]
MRRLVWSLVFGISLAGAHPGDARLRTTELKDLGVRLPVPAAWKLDPYWSKEGWASLYWDEAQSAAAASIDILFYSERSARGSREKFARSLERLTAVQPLLGEPLRENLRIFRDERLGKARVWKAVMDYTETLNVHTGRMRRAPARETYFILPHPRGIVVVRLQSTQKLHDRLQKTLLAVAESIHPI